MNITSWVAKARGRAGRCEGLFSVNGLLIATDGARVHWTTTDLPNGAYTHDLQFDPDNPQLPTNVYELVKEPDRATELVTVQVTLRALSTALKNAMVFARGNHDNSIALYITPGQLTITARSAGIGDANIVIKHGDTWKLKRGKATAISVVCGQLEKPVYFNCHYILDALGAWQRGIDEIVLHVREHNCETVLDIHAPDDTNTRAIVCGLKWEDNKWNTTS